MQVSGLGMILVLAASMVQMASSICSVSAMYTDGRYHILDRMTDNFTSGDLASNKPVISDGRIYRYFNVPEQFQGMAMYAQAASDSVGANKWLGQGDVLEDPWKIHIDIADGPVTVYFFVSTTGGTYTGGFPDVATSQGWTKVHGSPFQAMADGFSRFDVQGNNWPGEAKDAMWVWSKTITEDTEITGLAGIAVGGLLVSSDNSYGCYTTTNTSTTRTSSTSTTTTTTASCGIINSVEGGGVTWDSHLVLQNRSLINGPGSDYMYVNPPDYLDGGEAWGNLKPGTSTPWPFSEAAYQNTDLVINFTGPIMMYIWIEGEHSGSAALRNYLLGSGVNGGFTQVDAYGFSRRHLVTGDQNTVDLYQKYIGETGSLTLSYNLPGLLVGGVMRDPMLVCTTTTSTTTMTNNTGCGGLYTVSGGGATWAPTTEIIDGMYVTGGLEYTFASTPSEMLGGMYIGTDKSGTPLGPWPGAGEANPWNLTVTFAPPVRIFLLLEESVGDDWGMSGVAASSACGMQAMLQADAGWEYLANDNNFTRVGVPASAPAGSMRDVPLMVYSKYFATEESLSFEGLNAQCSLVAGFVSGSYHYCSPSTTTTTTTTTTFHKVVLYNSTLYLDITNAPITSTRALTCAAMTSTLFPQSALQSLVKSMLATAVPRVETRFITIDSLSCCSAPAIQFPVEMTEVAAGDGYLCASYTVLMEQWEVDQTNFTDAALEAPATNMNSSGYVNAATAMWASFYPGLTSPQRAASSGVTFNAIYTQPVVTNMRAMNWFMSTETSTTTTTTTVTTSTSTTDESTWTWLVVLLVAVILLICMCVALAMLLCRKRDEQVCV